MESSKVGYWLQVGANIGILAGLVLVGFQINQTTGLIRLQILYEEAGRAIENESTLLGENPSAVIEKSVSDPTNLSYEEMRILEAYHWRPIAQLERRYELRELLGEEWKSSVPGTTWTLGTPFGRAWWDNVRDSVAPGVREVVDADLMERPVTSQIDYFNGVKANLARYLTSDEDEP